MRLLSFLFPILISILFSYAADNSTYSTTFSVAPVEPSKTIHSEIKSLSNDHIQRWANGTEMLILENAQLVHPLADGFEYRVKNAFIGAVFSAYSHHYSLELSVEDIWVIIAHGVSMHINQNVEKFRHLLVHHEGKKELILIVDDLLIPMEQRIAGRNLSIPAVDWPVAVHRLCNLIKADMKADLTSVLTKPFSQTTSVQQVIFDACLMDSVKAYYTFEVRLTCGIPQITLRGSVDDFQEILDRLNQLKVTFTDLHWWLDQLMPHIEKFKESVQGKPDIEWWRKMVGEENEFSGSHKLTGWLVDFIPYISLGDNHYYKVERRTNDNNNKQQGRVREHGIDFSLFKEAVTQTDFILNNNGDKTNMKLIAGFFGIGQNPDTGALRPVLGWLTALTSPSASPTHMHNDF